jgi:hypothetical protein
MSSALLKGGKFDAQACSGLHAYLASTFKDEYKAARELCSAEERAYQQTGDLLGRLRDRENAAANEARGLLQAGVLDKNKRAFYDALMKDLYAGKI